MKSPMMSIAFLGNRSSTNCEKNFQGKTLPDHKADRADFVRQLLAQAGLVKPDTSHWVVKPVEPGDQSAPPRDHVILAAIAQRTTWRAEYTRAL